MRAQNAVVEKESADGVGGEGGSSIEHKAQKSKSVQRGKNESAGEKGEEAGGSKSKLNGHRESDCIMELLAEIQMDIKANRRQCEKIEQVLASHHTRAIEETNADDAKAAIEVVRQMQAATLSPDSSPSSLLTPRSPYSSPSSSLTPRSPSSVLRQMPPASTSPLHTHTGSCAPHTPMPASPSLSPKLSMNA